MFPFSGLRPECGFLDRQDFYVPLSHFNPKAIKPAGCRSFQLRAAGPRVEYAEVARTNKEGRIGAEGFARRERTRLRFPFHVTYFVRAD